jgi:hypothetical protein
MGLYRRYTYRWCSIKECYDSEEDCFHSCQNNHRLATSPISKLDSNTSSSGDDSLGISREGADTTSLLDDADYIVPIGQCCENVGFGRYTYRWCPLKECYDSKEECFQSCQNNHQPAAPTVWEKP